MILTTFRSYCALTRTPEQTSLCYEERDSSPICGCFFLVPPPAADGIVKLPAIGNT